MGTTEVSTIILNWNARSLRAKKIELGEFLYAQNIDVGVITETRLTPSICFSITGYTTIRLDRTNSSGGGVAILLRKGMRYSCLPHPGTKIIEAVGVELETSSGNIRIYAVYCPRQCRPRNGESNLFKCDLAKLTRSRSKFVVCGDLNARHE